MYERYHTTEAGEQLRFSDDDLCLPAHMILTLGDSELIAVIRHAQPEFELHCAERLAESIKHRYRYGIGPISDVSDAERSVELAREELEWIGQFASKSTLCAQTADWLATYIERTELHCWAKRLPAATRKKLGLNLNNFAWRPDDHLEHFRAVYRSLQGDT